MFFRKKYRKSGNWYISDQVYIDYIKYTTGPLEYNQFIEDWGPEGEAILNNMIKKGIINISYKSVIYLVR